MSKKHSGQKLEIVRIVQYMVSGGAFFWSGYLAFFFVDKVLMASFFWAKVTSTLVGWTVNFLLQRYWVFKNPRLKGHFARITGRYLFISALNLVIDYFLVLKLKDAGLTPYLGMFVSAGFFTVWNYLWYKYWVFPESLASLKQPAVKERK